MLQLVDTAFCFALPATTSAALERRPHSAMRYILGLRPENILLQPYPGAHLLPATISLLEPLGREVLLSATCGPHLLKVLVPALACSRQTHLYGSTSARGRTTFRPAHWGGTRAALREHGPGRQSYAAVSFKRLSCATASVVHCSAAWSMLL